MVVPFKITKEEAYTANEIFVSCAAIAFFGQFNDMFNKSFESPIAIYQEFFFGYNLPPFIKQIVIFLLGLFVSKRLADDLKCVKVYDREEIDRVYKLKARFCAHIAERWKTESLDAVISPTYFHSAFKANDKDNKLALKADYTTFWNVLHYPAGVVPITEVLKEEEEGYEDGYNDIITKACRDSLRGSAGMPISLQVATLKFKDE